MTEAEANTSAKHRVTTTEQTLEWADGEYNFRVDWPALTRIQEDCESGPLAILLRMQKGEWKVQEITSILRHALISGGTEIGKVQSLIKTYVEGLPPETNLPLATGVLYMGLFGFSPAAKAEPVQQESADQSADGA